MNGGPQGPGSRLVRVAAAALVLVLGCGEPTYTVPEPPAALATTPASPANENRPRLVGTAPSDLTILVFTDPFCAGPLAAKGTGLELGSPGIQVEVPDDSTTTFHVVGVRADGFASPCSDGVTYVEDSTPPAPPLLTATDPPSPGRAASVRVRGTAEADARVEIYTDPGCAGPVAATGAAADLTAGIAVAVPPNVTTTFGAIAIDAAGNRSACSSADLSYTEDDVAPAAPVLGHTVPASPSNASTTPVVVGTAAPLSAVAIYGTSDCSGTPLAETDADAAGDFAVQVTVAANATTLLRGTATDAAGNASPCSSPLGFTHDDVPPAAPVLTATVPASPSRTSVTPSVSGTAEAGAEVTLYAGAGCSGPSLGTATADASGAFAITATVTGNTRTTFQARARDAAGNLSACTETGLVYVHDSVAPIAPALTGVTPASPSRTSTTPTVTGTAEDGATVQVYATADCSGAPLASTTAAGGTFTVQVTVPADAATSLAVTATDAAGNVSACVGGLTYTHDSVAPAAPSLTGTTPASPTNVTRTPAVSGTAEPGAAVTLYGDAACAGSTLGAGSADAGGAFSIVLSAPVTANQAATLYATATDGAGNVSPCSTGLGFLFDDQPPAVPTGVGVTPASPSPQPQPTVTGTADAGVTVRVSVGSCTGTVLGTGTAGADGAFGVALATAVPANQTSQLYVAAIDAAGNVSACAPAVAYTHDDIAPPPPAISGSTPASPANTSTTTLHGTAEAGATVEIFAGAGCPGSAVATGTADGAGAFDVTVAVAGDAQSVFYAEAVDAAGNRSDCSATGLTFIEDSSVPAVPTLSGTVPPSPSNDTNPAVQGTADPGVTVTLYTSSTCTTGVLGSGIADGAGAFSIAVIVPLNQTTAIYAAAKDAANNTSGCGGPLGYVEDSAAPAAPAFTGTTPASPSKTSTTPTLDGTAEPGATVSISAGACPGTVIATGAADGSGVFHIGVTVGADTTTTFYARATDAAGNGSPCSAGVTYRHDDQKPAPPSGMTTAPGTPSQNARPTVAGAAEAGATVQVYVGACSGTVYGTGVADGTGHFSVPLTVDLPEAADVLVATATDAAMNISDCGTGPTYTLDQTAPAAPSALATSPAPPDAAHPANTATPHVTGTAEAGSAVRVFLGACTGAPVGSGTADGSGHFDVTVAALTSDGAKVYVANATDAALNTSLCSTGVTYYYDGTAPAAPTSLATSPATTASTPSNTATPHVTGTAEAGATVRVFLGACTGTQVGTGVADGSGHFDLTVTALTSDGATTFVATATDVASNTSVCSTGVTYYYDGGAPAAPSGLATNPATADAAHPANTATPHVTGTAEAGSTVRVFLGACTGAPVGSGTADGSGHFDVTVATLTSDGAKVYVANATDAAQNTSGCAAGVTYYYDGTSPDAPTGLATNPATTAAAPSNVATPHVTGTAEASATVRVYRGGTCGTNLVGTGTADGTGHFDIAVTALTSDGAKVYVANATDAALNTSGCSSGVTYYYDGTAPGAPGGLATTPATTAAAPSNTATPHVTGTAEAGSIVRVFLGACTGTPVGTGTADGSGHFDVTVAALTSDGAKTYVANATDAAQNTSLCSSGVIYYYDATAPGAPSGLVTSPATADADHPANTATPHLTGAAEAGSTVRVFFGACTGTPVGSGTADGSGHFDITVAALTSDGAKTFVANATDAASNTSLCSDGATYYYDGTAPAAPSALATSPAAADDLHPATETRPHVTGTAEAGATVRVYLGGTCGVNLVGSGTADASNAFDVQVDALTGDGAKGFVATATDVADNTSSCSGGVTYYLDLTAPTFGGLTSVTALSPTQLELDWSAAADAVTPAASLWYDICETTDWGGCGAAFAVTHSVQGATSWTFTTTANTRHFFVVRARDLAGHSDTNTTQVMGKTPGLAGEIAVAAGAAHTCALDAGGGVQCSGANARGQLGDGTTDERHAPVLLSGLSRASAIAAGTAHTCAITGGAVDCWGANDHGQLGAAGPDQTSPTGVSFASSVPRVALAGGGAHTCALFADGTVWCWGANAHGQLGVDTGGADSTPVHVGGIAGAVALAAGDDHTCAALADGSAWCWGANGSGQLGSPATSGDSIAPVQVMTDATIPLAQVIGLAGGGAHTCAVTAAGAVACWGDNTSGQLGVDPTGTPPVPSSNAALAVDLGADLATGLSARALHTCATLAEGTLTCWGGAAAAWTPAPVASPTDAAAVAAGADFACALRAGGGIACWGQNLNGQFGNGSTLATPADMTALAVAVPRALVTGAAHSCVLLADGTVRCWGANDRLQTGSATAQAVPVDVQLARSAVALDAGGANACAVLVDGKAACWGDNANGQLGSAAPAESEIPVAVGGGTLTDLVGIAAGPHACAVRADGTVWCWGRNANGELGRGSTTPASDPTPLAVTLPGPGRAVGVAVGDAHTCALLVTGRVACWGANANGQLGDGTTADSAAPALVPGLTGVVEVRAAAADTCAVLADGTARCWGAGTSGQLGDGSSADSSTPVAVGTLQGVVAIRPGPHACALLATGAAACWGANASGELGDGTTSPSATPIAVPALTSVSGLGVGQSFTCARRADGAVSCWGANDQHQLGDGTTTARATPAPVEALP
jgi:alpha-tubulin suppressor-like RCC1 family protein